MYAFIQNSFQPTHRKHRFIFVSSVRFFGNVKTYVLFSVVKVYWTKYFVFVSLYCKKKLRYT